MLRAYAQAYAAAAAAPANARSLSQDSSAAVNCVIAGANSAALAWDDDFGEFYKKRYCSKTEYYFRCSQPKVRKRKRLKTLCGKTILRFSAVPI